MRLLILLFGIGILQGWARSAVAESMFERSSASYFLRTQRSTLIQQGLGSLCTVMTLPSSDIPCNPSLLPSSEESFFVINMNLGDDYDTIYKNRDLLNGKDKSAVAESLLSERRPLQFQGAAQIWWRSPYFSVAYEPARWTYYSRVRNQAFPDIAVHALQEQSLQIQGAGFWDKNWSAGFSLKAVDRRFVQEEFNLFEALPHIDDYFQVKTQKALWIEPGVSYLIDDENFQDWQPRLSLMVSQLGYVDHLYDEVPTQPYADTGLSISRAVFSGQWEWALSYRWITNPDMERKFRLGTQYQIGPFHFFAAYDRDEYDLGARGEVKTFSVGWLFKKQNWVDFEGQSAYEEANSIELRLIF